MDEEKQVVEEGRGLTFKDILFIIRKHWIAIVVFIFLGTAAGFTWTKVEQRVRPVYKSDIGICNVVREVILSGDLGIFTTIIGN